MRGMQIAFRVVLVLEDLEHFSAVHSFDFLECPAVGDVVTVTYRHPTEFKMLTNHWHVHRRQFDVSPVGDDRGSDLLMQQVTLYVTEHSMLPAGEHPT